jgi:hypothetical protein
MRAARIENGIVADLWEVPSLDCFEGITLIEAPAFVAMGASYDGSSFVNPAAPADTRTYAQKRAAEYPPMTDYLDGIVKSDQAQIDKYIADCLAVKTKYPKT